MKSANWISATGRRPFSAAPIATPTIESSASGVSITRSSPKRPRRPSVALKTPPLAPTSSPSTMTRSSRAISSASVSRTVSTIVFTAIASPPLPRAVLIPCIDVQTKGVGGGLRTRFGEGDGFVHQRAGALAQLVLDGVVQDLTLLQRPAEEVERILAARQLDLLGRAIAAVVVVAGVGGEAADAGVDQGRPTTGLRSLHCLGGRLVDREGVRPVDGHARHAVGGSSLGHRG